MIMFLEYFGNLRKRPLYSNQWMCTQLSLYRTKKHYENITLMKNVLPNVKISDSEMDKLFQKAISIHQTNKNQNGQFLESLIREMLMSENISFQEQVIINQSGNIVDSSEKRKPCYHMIDFVIGDEIRPGTNIQEYAVLSCKTTCRERWTQDNWTLRFPPRKYILITTSNDYPNHERFQEGCSRKIITCKPKRNDDRVCKLEFRDLLSELDSFKN